MKRSPWTEIRIPAHGDKPEIVGKDRAYARWCHRRKFDDADYWFFYGKYTDYIVNIKTKGVSFLSPVRVDAVINRKTIREVRFTGFGNTVREAIIDLRVRINDFRRGMRNLKVKKNNL